MTDIVSALRKARVLAPIGVAAAVLAGGASSAQTQKPGYSVDLSTPYLARPPEEKSPDRKTGSVAISSVGIAGQRQQKQGVGNIKPMARIDTRIANRVESRIRNRIDRYYDPQANATSPFKVAAERARTAPEAP